MNLRILLGAALLGAASLSAQTYTMRTSASPAPNSMTYYEYPVSNGALVYSSEYVPSGLVANVGFQLRILSNHNLIGGKLSKPIIIPQGFDVDWNTGDQTDFQDMENLLSRVVDLNTLAQTSQANLVKTLYNEGYEIVLVLFKNPTTAVTDNSWAMQGLTLKIASWLERPNMPIRYVGPSMGGLIERHALQTFRTRFSGILPNINQFLAFDSPQRGALVPMSVQGFVMFHSYHDATNTQKYKNLISPAAKQMLLYSEQRGSYNWDVNSATTTINGFENGASTHGQFMQTLDNGFSELLNYSRYSYTAGDISRIAVLNGSGEGAALGLPQNTAIAHFSATSGDEVGAEHWYTQNGSANSNVYTAWIDSWGTEDDQNYFQYYLNGDPCFVENAPGGTRNSYAEAAYQYETAEPDYADTEVTGWNYSFGPNPGDPAVKPVVTGSTAQGHSFVPTASGLGLIPAKMGKDVNSTGFWFPALRSVANSNDYKNVSVFKKAYMPVKNQPHMYITTENKQWFLNELRSYPTIDMAPVSLLQL